MISPVPNIIPVLSLKPQSPMLNIAIVNAEKARAEDMLRGVGEDGSFASPRDGSFASPRDEAAASVRIVEPRAQEPILLDRRA